MKPLLIIHILIFILVSNIIQAQLPYTVKGQVVDKNSKEPIPYATVKLFEDSNKNFSKAVTTNNDGSFTLNTKSDNIKLSISFIGYNEKLVDNYQLVKNEILFGVILLEENQELLKEVEVEDERSKTEFHLDKRVFHVNKDLSSSGASALEVLDNVPSVNVNIEGQISLRGNTGVQILVNGKPSVLADEEGGVLGTITADMIEKIEVITNPSAKYEAEGSSGIINIILKKNENKDLNGSISINTGIPDNHSLGISLNRRTDKFNLFSQLGIGYRSSPRFRENETIDRINKTSILSDGDEFRNELFYNIILGADYHINKNNVLTLSGSYTFESEDQPSETHFTSKDSINNIVSSWKREETTTADNPKYQYELNYKRDFEDHEDHDLVFSALGNFFGKDLSSEFKNTTESGTNSDAFQTTATDFKESRYTFKMDYTQPHDSNYTLELGSQYVLQSVSNDYTVSDYINNQPVVNEGLTNIFDYDQNVLGIYATEAYEKGKWGAKVGLRLENTDLSTLLRNNNQKNKQNYTDLFPSAHLSYKVNDVLSTQVSYSRRIFRPRLWHLNPFFNIRNNFQVWSGNPNLLPEYTDGFEVGLIYLLQKLSLNLNIYQKNTYDVITRVTLFDNGVSTTIPINAGERYNTGLEINAKYNLSKKTSLNTDFNYNYSKRVGEFQGDNFDFSFGNWSAKATFKVNLPYSFTFETTGRYNSKKKTIQGEQSDFYVVHIGLRKKIMKGKIVANFSIRDLFKSRIQIGETDEPEFYNYTKGYYGRFYVFGISYAFGKGEAMQYSGGRRH